MESSGAPRVEFIDLGLQCGFEVQLPLCWCRLVTMKYWLHYEIHLDDKWCLGICLFINRETSIFLMAVHFLAVCLKAEVKLDCIAKGKSFFFSLSYCSEPSSRETQILFIYITSTISHVDDILGAALNDKLWIKFK